MTLGELFSGIGGWSEAAKMCGGITPIWCSEIDKYIGRPVRRHCHRFIPMH